MIPPWAAAEAPGGLTEAEMSKNHFSYLVDEDAAPFFQKVACADAEAVYGVRPVELQPAVMEKTAAPSTRRQTAQNR